MNYTILKTTRKARKINQLTMAKEIGISRNYLSKIENNRANPALSILTDLCKELDLSVSILTEEMGDVVDLINAMGE